jgi:hypothetical protein
MSSPFARAPIYALGARRPADARTLLLGWPVWAAYARVGVAGPSSRDRLDLFEAGILDLSAAGITDRREMAADLDLDLDLVAHVVAALQVRELLDRSLVPTASAKELLAMQLGQREHHVSGFVLVDAWEGRVLSGLHSTLEPLETGNSRPARGGSWESIKVTVDRTPIRMSLLPARLAAAPDVEAADEQAAVREALSRGNMAISSPAAIRSITALGAPWPARVLVWAYRRLAGAGDEVWPLDREVRVLEPTGDEDAIYLEEALRELGSQQAGATVLAPLHQDDHRRSLGESARKAQRRLLRARLGSVPDDHPAVSSLADALVLRADEYGSQALVELGSALETTLRAAASTQSYERAHERISRAGQAAPVLEEALAACGFRPNVPSPTLRAAAGQRAGPLMLRSLAALIVMIAADDERHPLRTLALEESEDAAAVEGRPTPIAWLGEIDELAYHRNSAAHGVSDRKPRPQLDSQTLDRWFHLVERAIHHLLRSP